jgi:hypothetical protein
MVLRNLAPQGGKGFEKPHLRGGKVLKNSSRQGPYVLRTDISRRRRRLYTSHLRRAACRHPSGRKKAVGAIKCQYEMGDHRAKEGS